MLEWVVGGLIVKAITKKVGKDRAGQTAEEELAVLRSGKPLSARLTFRAALIALIRKHLGQDECQYGRRAKSEDWLLQCSAGRTALDHKVPLNQGGHNTLDNFQFLCTKHNSSKGDDTQQAFFVRMRELRDSKVRDKQTAKLKREAILKANKERSAHAKVIATQGKARAASTVKARAPRKPGGILGRSG